MCFHASSFILLAYQVNYYDERDEEGLVHAIAVDDLNKRIIVGFRGSVSKKDWQANFDAMLCKKTNPLKGETMKIGKREVKQPEKVLMHRGFRDYVFADYNADEDADVTKDEREGDTGTRNFFDEILENAATALENHPGYSLYTTGLSLGGALTTVFALFAAASKDPRIPKPVTSVAFGSPKSGSLSFRKAFQSLEDSGNLRFVHVINENDIVKELPRK